jgi:predicted Zn-dependent protease
VPGEAAREDLFAEAEGGLFLPEAERGYLDSLSGEFILHFPYGYRIRGHAPGPPVGRSVMRAHVTDVLKAVRAVGRDAVAAGAGWCAKGGMKLPVWATAPDLLVTGVRIGP